MCRYRWVITAVCKDYEGPAPTQGQANLHPHGTMAFAAWVFTRLGGWAEYYGKPGPLKLNRGLTKYYAINYGTQLQGALE